MSDHRGWWAVVETGQGGGLPDTLHGPYWSAREAEGEAAAMHAEMVAVGRHDQFIVAYLDVDAS